VIRPPCAFASDDGRADGAVVERLGAVAADQLEATGQVGIAQDVARVRHPAVAEEDLARALPGAEVIVFCREDARERLADREALARERDGRCEQRATLHRAVVIQRIGQAGHGARDADRRRREQRLVDDHPALVVEIHVARRRRRRGLAEVDRDVLAGLAVVQDHEAAAADVARVGQRHRQRETDRHGRIDRVAALAQHVHADVRGQRTRRADHAVQGVHRVEYRVVEVVVDEARGRRPGLCAGDPGRRDGCGRQRQGEAGRGERSTDGRERGGWLGHGQGSLAVAVKWCGRW